MKKILIAMDSQLQSQQLNLQLSGQYCVAVCNCGEDALNIIKKFQPDLMVVDLFLSDIDGVSLLELFFASGIRPRVIAISPYISDYVTAALERLQVNCLLRSSCNIKYLAARIVDLLNWEETPTTQAKIDYILAVLGFKMNTSGYRITRLALQLYVQNPNQAITSSLYPSVAHGCGGTVTQVEKAIRDSITGAWKDRNDQIWSTYFTIGKNGKVSKPSNGDFLARIGYCICEESFKDVKRKIS